MSYWNYRIWKIVIVILVSVLVGWSIVYDNVLIPVPAMTVGIVVMWFLKKGVKEATLDERVFSVADKAAMFVFRIFILLASMAATTIFSLDRDNINLEQAGLTLAFSACILAMFYYLAFIYYNRKYGG